MNYPEAMERARLYDGSLLATDPRFKRSVLIIHEDGSIFHLGSAFLMQQEGWLFMFSNHHSYRVFDKSDLLSFAELKKSHNSIEKMP